MQEGFRGKKLPGSHLPGMTYPVQGVRPGIFSCHHGAGEAMMKQLLFGKYCRGSTKRREKNPCQRSGFFCRVKKESPPLDKKSAAPPSGHSPQGKGPEHREIPGRSGIFLTAGDPARVFLNRSPCIRIVQPDCILPESSWQ